MLLIDDILLFPLRGFYWVTRQVYDAAQREIANEGDSIRSALSELYMMLETGRISEEEFTTEETHLLDRLDQFELRGKSAEEEEPVVRTP